MIVGIDLAGPKNHRDTSLTIIDNQNINILSNLSDSDIYKILTDNNVDSIGIDAPLSYSEVGGYRKSDSSLRKLLNDKGFHNIGIMPPTYMRMIYLTARGIRLTRLISYMDNSPKIYEAHPGAFLVLDNYPYELVANIKKDEGSIKKLIELIKERGYQFKKEPKNDHELMSVGVALAVEAKLCNRIHWEFKTDAMDDFTFIS